VAVQQPLVAAAFMCDTTWTPADLAANLCDALVAAGKLRATPAFIRTDREAKLADVFASCGLDGAKLLSFTNPRELEVVIRGATQGESWVDDVQSGLAALLCDLALSSLSPSLPDAHSSHTSSVSPPSVRPIEVALEH
jgi:hypothetical protein